MGRFGLDPRRSAQRRELTDQPLGRLSFTLGCRRAVDPLELFQPLPQPVLVGFAMGRGKSKGGGSGHEGARYPLAKPGLVMHLHTMWVCSEPAVP